MSAQVIMTDQDAPDELLTLDEVAALARVSKPSLKPWGIESRCGGRVWGSPVRRSTH